ncbi:hypothetical protein [Burkholderia ubonensis]|uniref:hypothetical protein n=1 Tax=Burkholderia ubonensis TaxID=101571 RepID=UPI000AAE4A68|nr:hypothetical protein [Burkholderia ubonensis]
MDAAGSKTLVQRVAENLGKDESDVDAVLSEFTLQLHRALFEKFEGDYLAQLYRELPHQAYFHFLGFLDRLAAWYGPIDSHIVSEYLSRLAGRAVWRPFVHQMEAWVEFAPPRRDEDDLAGV